jgi:hypothetical protein
MSELTQDLREKIKQRTLEVLDQPGSMQRFAPSPLATIDPRFASSTSFIPPDVQNQLAGAFQQQRAPGAQYLNYPMAAPNIGGPLMPPTMPPGFGFGQPAPTPSPTPSPSPSPSPSTDPVMGEDVFSNPQAQEFLDEINNERMERGLDPYETIQDYINDQRGPIGMAEGGIASLEPQGMFIGGLMSAIGQGAAAAGGALAQGASALGGAAAKGLGSLKDIALKGMQNYNANTAAGGIGGLSGKRIEDMTREELIELIKTGKKPSGGLGADLKTIGNAVTDFTKGRPSGGTAALNQMGDLSMLGYAGGGDVDFPRMNGPISGPGTETSDDIPAMLSDGEFVVNAKAVRGIGKLEGANQSKEEQRREGARMMYALQRAGEKAMRKA